MNAAQVRKIANLVRIASLAAGLSYLWVVVSGTEGMGAIIWKGAGVWLLAIYAALRTRDENGWLIAIVMALGAAGDVMLETQGLTAGALAFALGHLVAGALYIRNRRPALSLSQKWFALVLAVLTPLIAFLLTRRGDIGFYAFLLGGMASLAWTSRFPRYRVGIGAVLFVLSDLLIFARMGPFAGIVAVSVLIWLAYFIGQYLIATGVIEAEPAVEPGLR